MSRKTNRSTAHGIQLDGAKRDNNQPASDQTKYTPISGRVNTNFTSLQLFEKTRWLSSNDPYSVRFFHMENFGARTEQLDGAKRDNNQPVSVQTKYPPILGRVNTNFTSLQSFKKTRWLLSNGPYSACIFHMENFGARTEQLDGAKRDNNQPVSDQTKYPPISGGVNTNFTSLQSFKKTRWLSSNDPYSACFFHMENFGARTEQLDGAKRDNNQPVSVQTVPPILGRVNTNFTSLQSFKKTRWLSSNDPYSACFFHMENFGARTEQLDGAKRDNNQPVSDQTKYPPISGGVNTNFTSLQSFEKTRWLLRNDPYSVRFFHMENFGARTEQLDGAKRDNN